MNNPVSYRFSASTVHYHFSERLQDLQKLVAKDRTVIITDDNVFDHHKSRFRGWNTIVLRPGEAFKVQATVPPAAVSCDATDLAEHRAKARMMLSHVCCLQ